MSDKLQYKLKQLEAKQASLFRRIQLTYDSSKDLTNSAQKNNFLTRILNIDDTRKEYVELIEKINELNFQLNPDYVPNYQPLESFEELYCHIRYAKQLIDEEKINDNKHTVIQKTSDPINEKSFIKLPTLEIPGFSGDIKEWPVFYETFRTTIHENPHLSNVDKVRYLISKLTKGALAVTSGIPPTADNYVILWEALVNRYQDKRFLASVYLKQIFEFKRLTSQTNDGLESFIQHFCTAVDALKGLRIDDLLDLIFLHLSLSKLDKETVQNFEMSVRDKNIPAYNDLTQYVMETSKILLRNRSFKQTDPVTSNSKTNFSKFSHALHANKSNTLSSVECVMCGKIHQLYHCDKFLKLPSQERFSFAKSHSLCINCLSSKHNTTRCRSKNKCNKCQKNHHSTLHFNTSPSAMLSATKNSHTPQEPTICQNQNGFTENSLINKQCASLNACSRTSASSVILPTAIVNAYDRFNKPHSIRILLDSASQSNFISKNCFNKLNLKKNRLDTSVIGIGASRRTIRFWTNVVFTSQHDANSQYHVDALIIDKITDLVPTYPVPAEFISHLQDVPLADKHFYLPGSIDMLIGAELFFQFLRPAKIIGPPNTPTALQSSLGYIVMGKYNLNSSRNLEISQSFCTVDESSLENLVKNFWKLEEIPTPKHLEKDDAECERIFMETYRRLPNGKYSVSLPFKRDPTDLGSSLELCKKRFERLENRFAADKNLKLEYDKVIKDYIDLGHMTLSEFSDDSYYIPHHCVIRPDKLTTRIRIVFDASAKDSNNLSLNDVLFSGPKLQTDLIEILLRFRLFAIALTADITKMYRQIEINPQHRKFQKMLWRFSPNDELSAWTLNTVTFGVKPAPYLALRVTHQLALDEKFNNPLASEIINKDIYMDDLATSVESDLDGIKLYQQLKTLFKSGGFNLTKWSSNSDKILASIPKEDQIVSETEFEPNDSVAILGMRWLSTTDVLTFNVNARNDICTKRKMLSSLARIFDPLGLIAPVTMTAKYLIKHIWTLKLDWDDEPPPSVVSHWKNFQSQLPWLSEVKVPRYLFTVPSLPADIIGFCDASEKGYGAVLFTRVYSTSTNPVVTLLIAKSRVAPMKTVSIPRLELCGALLLTQLFKFVKGAFMDRLQFKNVLALSDSEIVLQWINGSPSRWKTFVANRVSVIQDNLPSPHWFHLSGRENPADCLSRGLFPKDLLQHSLWFSGPEWLKRDYSDWPIQRIKVKQGFMSEERKTALISVENQMIHPLRRIIDRCSSYKKLIRSTAYVLRFAKRSKSKDLLLSAYELESAEKFLLQIIQQQHFLQEIRTLMDKNIGKFQFKGLNPFFDGELIRVGGRLENSNLSYYQKHPVLLPKKDHFVNILIDYYHQNNFHTGPNLVLSLLRQKFWILGGRGVVRSRLQSCNFCFKRRPKGIFPLMGDLPAPRVNQSKPFLHTGVDYAGPFFITWSKRRGVKPQKAYLCLFVCLCTKALHLECASDLTSECFISSFKRFISRRGPCQVLYSDCGTNFIGANAKLSEIYDLINSEKYIKQLQFELSHRGIEWKFNPPAAPHFGGLWEAGVKSVKTHLKRITSHQIFTYEEFTTILAQVEALLNSRPLCVLSSDPNDPKPLTPAHFLLQLPLSELPAPDLTQIPTNHLTRYQLIDRLIQDFWKRWHVEYLHTLQIREKWNTPTQKIIPGLIVLLKQENTPPMKWPLGIIDSVAPGKDNIVRVVTVRTQNGLLKRAVAKLCPLPIQ